jgi:hypothetical protein
MASDGYFFVGDILGFGNIIRNLDDQAVSIRIQEWVDLVTRSTTAEVTHQPRRDDFWTVRIQARSQHGGCDCQLDERSETRAKLFGCCVRPSGAA